jgi:CelD/BcsL family acetyltransferase involved in cellulose biosynthesis
MLRGALARGRADLSSYDVELIGASELHRVRDAWADLFDRSAECNVFYGPDLLAPLANSPLCDSSFRALIVWRLSPGSRTLAGFMPLRMTVSPLSAVRGFKHHYIVGCAPLIDEANPVNVAIAMMDGLAALRPGALLIMDDLRLDWAAWRAFKQAANATGRVFEEQDIFHRAGVTPHGDVSHLKGKIAQNLRRCGAKLTAQGQWTVFTDEDADAARGGLEALLAVEASGWKGAGGTALASKPETLAFARAAFDPANVRPTPRFTVLALDGRPIAVSMNLIGRDHAANLKCAYDEAYHAASPGVLLDAAMAERLRETSFTPMIDSVATPGHPVERLWPERLRCGWVAIACDPAMGLGEFHMRLSIEQLQRQMRSLARNAYHSAMPALKKVISRD